MKEDFLYREKTEKIIGCAMTVHNFLGPGFHESIYERCLLIELRHCGIECMNQVEEKIVYRDIPVGKKRLDILVENQILLELKAISELDKICFNKIINYLKVFGFEIGLLLNFGKERLEFRRFANFKNLRNPKIP
jgi:GxxExxY protein